MPSGRVHLRIEMFVLGLCTLVVAFLAHEETIDPWLGATFLVSYLISSLLLSPDLDLRRSHAAMRWGWGRIIWIPYARIFRHRALSHHLLLGPLTRIIYLAVIVLAVAYGLEILTGHTLRPALPPWPVLIAVFAGLYLPNQLHSIADRIWSLRRRR